MADWVGVVRRGGARWGVRCHNAVRGYRATACRRFHPALETAIVIADVTTSALLFAQFSIVPRLALLVLASGFLLSGMIVVPHALSFPGAFSPTGLLGGGAQSTAWLYHLWKLSLPVAVIVYVLLRDADIEKSMPQRPPVTVIGWSTVVVILIACGLAWLAAGEWLPRIGDADKND